MVPAAIMWRFADRYDLHMMVQATRAVARGPVARAVADGQRNTHDWTPAKAGLLKHYDESGITSAFMEPSEGGYLEGPKNLALSLLAFELSWVDAGAATAPEFRQQCPVKEHAVGHRPTRKAVAWST